MIGHFFLALLGGAYTGGRLLGEQARGRRPSPRSPAERRLDDARLRIKTLLRSRDPNVHAKIVAALGYDFDPKNAATVEGLTKYFISSAERGERDFGGELQAALDAYAAAREAVRAENSPKAVLKNMLLSAVCVMLTALLLLLLLGVPR
jgi:hypothetical protein